MAEFRISPTASVEQGGFSSEKGGNLRDHNGCYADPKAIAATVHYDGDYGTKPLQVTSGPLNTGPVTNPLARGSATPQPASSTAPAPTLQSSIRGGPAPVAPRGRDMGDRVKPKFTYVGRGTRG